MCKIKKYYYLMAGIFLFFAIPVQSYAGEICGKALFGIGYVLVLENVALGTEVDIPVFQTKCLQVTEGDYIRVSAALGKTLGHFTVGKFEGQIPIGGGIEAAGVTWAPTYSIVNQF